MTSSKKKLAKKTSALLVLAAFAGFAAPGPVRANPLFTQAESGDIRIEEHGPVYNIYASDRAIGSFESFSNLAGETINSLQGSPQNTALYRVTGAEPSTIFGALNANSRIFLVNPNGILFAPGSSVNAPGLVASAMNLSNQDFLAANYAFTSASGLGRVVNQGNLNASQYLVLLGKSVSNEGTIQVAGGTAALAAGDSARLLLDDQGLVSIDVTAPLAELAYGLDGERVRDAVANSGRLSAAGGHVILTAAAAGPLFDSVINHSGVIEAASVGVENGTVTLYGGAEGVVNVTGSIDASGREAGETGGTVHVLGDKVGLFGNASIDASGFSGGGTVLVGGDQQGLNPEIPNATAVYLSPDAVVRADALVSGDGGKIVLFAEDSAKIHGHLSARGGTESGNGGFIETSGKVGFEIADTPDVTAPHGSGGRWLIDPNNIEIVAGLGNVNITSADPFTSTNDTAQLGATRIVNALTGGASVDVITASSGTNAQSGDITLSSIIDFNGTGNNTLTFDADNDIFINAAILDSATGSVDKLNVILFAGHAITLNAAVTTGGGNFKAFAYGGNITLGNVANVINTICATCTNGNVELEAASGDIVVQNSAGGQTEIKGVSELKLTAQSVGAPGFKLGLESVFNLVIIDVNAAGKNMLIEELVSNSISTLEISAPNSTTGDIDIIFFNGDVVDINEGHFLNNVDVSGFNRQFEYIANTGNVTVTSLTTNTASKTTYIYANSGNVTFADLSTNVTGYLHVHASGSINGTGGGTPGDGSKEITLNGGMTLDANEVGNTNQLEVHVVNGAGNETFEAISHSTTGQNFNLQILNQNFDEMSISQTDTDTSFDIALPSTDVIDINGSATTVTLASIAMASSGSDFSYELTGTGTVAVQSVNVGGADLEITNSSGSITDSSSSITAGTATFDASANVGTAASKLNVNASTITADAGGEIGINSGVALADLDYLFAVSNITLLSANGFDVGFVSTGGGPGDVSITTSAGDILDLNGGALNFNTDTLTLNAPSGTVGTSGNPLEATFNSLTATTPNFVTKVESSSGQTIGGLNLLNGRITGGDNIDDLNTSLYGEQEPEGGGEESEDEEAEEEAAPVNPDASSTEQTTVEEAPPAEDEAPPVDSGTFSPCGI